MIRLVAAGGGSVAWISDCAALVDLTSDELEFATIA